MFKLQENGTTAARECVAGLTTFAAMAYILAVNPDILSQTGMDKAALITTTALVSAIGTLLMALLTNYPIAQAPGMGLNAFFAFGICLGSGVPWQGALGLVFWTGVLFLLISATGFRRELVRAIPECLKIGIQAGIGLFIAFIGLQKSGIVVASPATMVELGPFGDGWIPTAASLAFFGTALAAVLIVKRVPGAILIGIGVVALIGLVVPAGDSTVTPRPDGILGLPASMAPVFLQVDWFYPFKNWQSAWIILLTLLFVDLFDTVGTLIGVSRQANLMDQNGELPKIRNAFLADAGATTIGACLGSSPVTSYIESATGVEAGGRTGLTGVVVAGCFLLALFFTPLILAIPPAATAPALILVGVLMMKEMRHLEWDDFAQVVPAILTVVLIPLGFGIANGIALGFISYVIILFCTGRGREVHWLLTTLAILFLVKFLAVAAG